MTDHTSGGAVPAEHAAVPHPPTHPPTVDEVLEEQRRRDDLPDPSDDPRHQQVGPAGDDDSDELRQMLIEEARADAHGEDVHGERPPQAP